MIISFVNKSPASGKSSLCIGLANRLYDLPENECAKVIIFDCDPKLTSYTKFGDTKKRLRNSLPSSYQVMPLPVDNDALLYKTLFSVQDEKGFFLFDLPGNIDEWLLIRIIVSSQFIIVPFRPSQKSSKEFLDFLEYLLHLQDTLTLIKIKVKARIVLVPVIMGDNDNHKFNIKENSGFDLAPTIIFKENILESLDHMNLETSQEIYDEYTSYMLRLIKELSQHN